MKQWGSWILVTGLLAPQFGCLSLNPRTDTAALTGSAPNAGKEQANLPTTESVRICLHTAGEYARAGKFREAAIEYERARQYDPNQKNISRHLALLYDRLGMDTQAEGEFQKALTESPRDANLLNNYGYHFYAHEQWKQAEEQFRKALALNANHQAAWTNLGLTLARQERYTESLEAFQKVVKPAESFCNLALVLTIQKKFDQAKAAYQEALKLDSENLRARRALAKIEAGTNPPVPTVGHLTATPARLPEVSGGSYAHAGLAAAHVVGQLPVRGNDSPMVPDLSPIEVPAVGQRTSSIP